MSASTCLYCKEKCKNSDSRPYPNSRSKDRIHNRCQIKKSLANRKQPSINQNESDRDSSLMILKQEAEKTINLREKRLKEEEELRKESTQKDLQMIEAQQVNQLDSSQFFFDIKAGIAKPHEKGRYLHHRNLCEIAPRFDDNGFREEAIGRAYDHTGRDLNTLGDSDEDLKDCGDGPPTSTSLIGHSEPYKAAKKKFKSMGDKIDVRKQPNVRLDEKNPCWFCLSSPNVEKHLIIAIGDYCYLTLAKGGLHEEHFLIIPIEHIHSINSESNSKELLEELERFKDSIVDYFREQSLGVVFFERNFRSVHWQLQVVPIPLQKLDKLDETIKSTSKDHFEPAFYIEIPNKISLSDMIPRSVPYFYWQIEPTKKRFVMQINTNEFRFPVQFGRLVLTCKNILDCSDKVDWKACIKTKEEYTNLVEMVKNKYQNYDITS